MKIPLKSALPIGLGIIILIIIVLASQSAFTINYGSIGLITRFGQIVGEPLQPGLHFKTPFIDDVIVYRTQKIVYQTLFDDNSNSSSFGTNSAPTSANASQEDFFANSTEPVQASSQADYQDVSIDTTTKDGQQVKMTYTIRFAMNPDKIIQIANTLGTEAEVVEKVIKTDSRVWARNVPRNYEALDLYSGNIDKISTEIKSILKPIFENNGITLDEFAIRSIAFREDYVQIIEQKQIEKEKIQTEEFKAKQEDFKKQALITKAQGEAEAQRLQQQTLSKELIQKQYIEKWNGVLPTTVTGDNGLLLNLNP